MASAASIPIVHDQTVLSAIRSGPGGYRDPVTADDWLELFRLLHGAGRIDLPAARLLEGHIDAAQIVRRFADPATRERLDRKEAAGAALGVWNAPDPDAEFRVTSEGVRGGKRFASGAGLLSHALVSMRGSSASDIQLYLADLERAPPEIDESSWKAEGMARSTTFTVRWHGADTKDFTPIGDPGDYEREPWFSNGAVRFVAVQTGGLAGLFDRVRDALSARERIPAVAQRRRLRSLYLAAAESGGLLREAARQLSENPDTTVPLVALLRARIRERVAESVATARQALGLGSYDGADTCAAYIADLEVYACQPAPDAQDEKAIDAIAEGRLCPTL